MNREIQEQQGAGRFSGRSKTSDQAKREIKAWPSSDWEAGRFSHAQTSLPAEQPVEMIVNGQLMAVIHCTPANLDDLAAGFLLGHGFISSYAEIGNCQTDADQGIISVDLSVPLTEGPGSTAARTVIYSGCVQGQPPSRMSAGLLPIAAGSISVEPVFDAGNVSAALSQLLKSGEIYRHTRGIHSAAVCSRSGRIMALREDIGRHNALDKVLGWAARHGADPQKLFAVASGRISSEAVAKIIRFGIPLLATRGVPTSLALCMAEEKGITLAGSLGPGRLRVYTHRKRLK